ncbi:SDR family oxidoreductase [Plantactinospora sp. WMMB334]|uniref:SDR family oxidoreductase n=1 Tax=Plantactinospora sp. WMMB334 TaxID=3404119 RepID=UPI003B937CCB
MTRTVVITGASSGFGAMTARALAEAGHTVYAGMRDIAGRNARAAADLAEHARDHGVRAQAIEMDVSDQVSVDAAIDRIVAETGRLDVVVHNAGHMTLGPVEAFTPEQVASIYDTNVLSTQRVNRAALPHLRRQREGLLVWVGSSSSRGGTPPYLGPYFAAKAAEDALAVSVAAEVSRFGIDTSIIVPGAFTTGTNHFAHAGRPDDAAVVKEYEEVYAGVMDDLLARLAALTPPDADPTEVARQIARVVELPAGQRPFRVYVDPAQDGAEEVFRIGDRIRREFYRTVGYEDLLTPRA